MALVISCTSSSSRGVDEVPMDHALGWGKVESARPTMPSFHQRTRRSRKRWMKEGLPVMMGMPRGDRVTSICVLRPGFFGRALSDGLPAGSYVSVGGSCLNKGNGGGEGGSVGGLVGGLARVGAKCGVMGRGSTGWWGLGGDGNGCTCGGEAGSGGPACCGHDAQGGETVEVSWDRRGGAGPGADE
eukprot:2014078-Prymnesium_polylepis.1